MDLLSNDVERSNDMVLPMFLVHSLFKKQIQFVICLINNNDCLLVKGVYDAREASS